MIYDIRTYGLGTAFFNLRFGLAYSIAKFLIREPIRLSVSEVEDF